MLSRPSPKHLECGRQLGNFVNVLHTRAPTQLAVHGQGCFGGDFMLLNDQAPALTKNGGMRSRFPLMFLEQSGAGAASDADGKSVWWSFGGTPHAGAGGCAGAREGQVVILGRNVHRCKRTPAFVMAWSTTKVPVQRLQSSKNWP